MTTGRPRKRRLPFLQRNWTQGINHWQSMGARVSSPSRSSLEDKRHDYGDLDVRPRKRARLTAKPSSSDTAAPKMEELVLPAALIPPTRALRIDVLKIVHKDSERRTKSSISSLDTPSEPLTDIITIRARCRITILDISPLSKHRPPVLHCATLPCNIKTFKNPVAGSRMARIYLSHPFMVPEDYLKVITDDGVEGLADGYRLDVELLAAGDAEWPPLDICLPETRKGHARQKWVLLGSLFDLFKRSRSVDLFVHEYARDCLTPTNFIMDIDARWSSGYAAPLHSSLDLLEKGIMPSITVEGEEATPPPHTNGHLDRPAVNGHASTNGTVNGDAADPGEETGIEEETTPNRSLRHRENKIYNLKVLSDKAQGREKKRAARAAAVQPEDTKVTYFLPAEQVSLDSYRCVACGNAHQSLDQLTAHLHLAHPEYDYELRNIKGASNQFLVSHHFEFYSAPSETYQVGKPVKAFSLSQIASKDYSWITSRHGPDNEIPCSVPVDEVLPQTYKKPPSRKKDEKILIPNTKQRLYDSVTRTLLEPGTELVRPTPSDSWWIQKHRDMLNEFTDVDSWEKEYVWRWDAFILPRRISSDAFLPRAWLDFVRENASWIVSSGVRLEEFVRHACYLQARDVLDMETHDAALKLVQEARAKLPSNGKQLGVSPIGSPTAQGARKAVDCAECGLPVIGITCILSCSNDDCQKRFHSICIQKEAKMSPRIAKWLCNECAPGVNGIREHTRSV